MRRPARCCVSLTAALAGLTWAIVACEVHSEIGAQDAMRSERERVIRLAPMLAQAAEVVERETEIRHRAAGNGRVEPV